MSGGVVGPRLSAFHWYSSFFPPVQQFISTGTALFFHWYTFYFHWYSTFFPLVQRPASPAEHVFLAHLAPPGRPRTPREPPGQAGQLADQWAGQWVQPNGTIIRQYYAYQTARPPARPPVRPPP